MNFGKGPQISLITRKRSLTMRFSEICNTNPQTCAFLTQFYAEAYPPLPSGSGLQPRRVGLFTHVRAKARTHMELWQTKNMWEGASIRRPAQPGVAGQFLTAPHARGSVFLPAPRPSPPIWILIPDYLLAPGFWLLTSVKPARFTHAARSFPARRLVS